MRAEAARSLLPISHSQIEPEWVQAGELEARRLPVARAQAHRQRHATAGIHRRRSLRVGEYVAHKGCRTLRKRPSSEPSTTSRSMAMSRTSPTGSPSDNCFINAVVSDDLVNPGGIMDLWVTEARLFKFGLWHRIQLLPDPGRERALSGGGKSSGVDVLPQDRRPRRRRHQVAEARPGGPPRWSSSTSTIPTSRVHRLEDARGGQGPGPDQPRRATPPTSTARPTPPSPDRTRTTRCGSPTSSSRPSSTTATGTSLTAPTGRSARPSRPATSGARSPRRPGPAPTPVSIRHHHQRVAHLARPAAGSAPPTPAREYVFLDNTACNLASINLVKFFDDD